MRARRRRLKALGGSVLCGLLWFAAGEPLGWAPVAWVALVPLFWAVLGERRWRWAWLYGFVAAFVSFGLHLSWIFLFGWMAWSALVVVLSLYPAFAAMVAGMARRWPLAPVLAAGAWVGFELVRDRWPFGGFPWGALGTTQANMPGVRWLAGTVGAYGLSFLAAFAAALLADRFRSGRFAWGSVALVGGVLALFVGVDAVRYGSPGPGRPVDLAVVQGNVPRPARFDQRDRILSSHLRLTRDVDRRVDLIVWPEDAIGIGVSPGATGAVQALAGDLSTPMLVGRSEADRAGERFFNTVVHVNAEGGIEGTYVKRHPVPFGEDVPLGFLRRYVTTLEQVPYDLARGGSATVFDVEGAGRVATPICFESVFPRDFRDFARSGAEFYVVATNNASFERSFATDQHLAHSRLRALELRQWVVQAALSGSSAVIAPDGTMSSRTGLFEEASFTATIGARPASSLYARVGDLFSAGWTLGTLVAVLVYLATLAAGRLRRARPR